MRLAGWERSGQGSGILSRPSAPRVASTAGATSVVVIHIGGSIVNIARLGKADKGAKKVVQACQPARYLVSGLTGNGRWP